MRKAVWLAMTLASASCATVPEQSDVVAARKAWHAERIDKLREEDGWLTLVGLDFIEDGAVTLGSAESATYSYPNCADALVGTLRVDGDEVWFRYEGLETEERLAADDMGAPSVIRSGSVSFTLVRRNARLALRVRDNESPVRTRFLGLQLFPYDPDLVVRAEVVQAEPGARLAITNVTGFLEEQALAAELEFELDGTRVRFAATAGSDGRLFVVFGDATNGSETYAAGRFLDLPAPVDGVTTLDFNRATNPPCSFTAFATCPLPPPQNRLRIPIRAGELAPTTRH
ncbi:MAG: DUF1684 domain-containing protein [Planctomycetes bacterium]|nr:DUF1684 domain-containing protein [Planctomycetota bacterium]